MRSKRVGCAVRMERHTQMLSTGEAELLTTAGNPVWSAAFHLSMGSVPQ